MGNIEIWGGLECTLNRVGDNYFNQCEKNGHQNRISDLSVFKNLGIKKIRYPCLWELVAPTSLDQCDWRFLDKNLTELRNLNLNFISGFLHHGSGPYYTSLIDPEFPEKLATYARLFALRYPWVNEFTPINEINTTARFSLLYGHWYPHLKSNQQYLKSLILQCRGTILAMKEIKRINPNAKLIQTDDLGKCQSTFELKNQCDFENERRWLAWDLLTGKLTKGHPLYDWIISSGVNEDELLWFEDNAFPPDIIGINHYFLSNRYLDHRLDLFPENIHGGNGNNKYADVGAIDTGLCDTIPYETIILETWERYKIPIAITECHTRGYRETQAQWLYHVWNTCQKLKQKNVDVRAVTAWSLLGSFDWNSLCTSSENFYESGVFDLNNPKKEPRPTVLAEMIKSLAESGDYNSPILKSDGIWMTGRRILLNAQIGQFSSLNNSKEVRPVLIAGATGTLGQAFARACGSRNIRYISLGRNQMDLSKDKSIEEAIEYYKPWAFINATGYVNIDEAEDNIQSCFKINVDAVARAIRICKERNIRIVNFSSDQVFDGNLYSYSESNKTNPLNIYGKSKQYCEEKALGIWPESLIIRTSSFFGPWDEHNFITKTLKKLVHKKEVFIPHDIFISPTYIPDLVHETINLLIDNEKGIFHLTNKGNVSWADFAIKAASMAPKYLNIDKSLIQSISSDLISFRAKRPKSSVLTSEKYSHLPSYENGLERYFVQLQIPLMNKKELFI